jgi:hypothetical protein
MKFAPFLQAMFSAVWWNLVYLYYQAAHRNVGFDHPDGQLIFQRMFAAQVRANDALRRLT